jgi:hypothetical protein
VDFRCEDLPEAGVVLLTRNSLDYEPLLADIKRRLSSPVEGSPPRLNEALLNEQDPTAAILVNKSCKAIAAWSLIWRYEEYTGRQYGGRYITGVGGVPSLLLPFGMTDEGRTLSGYWHVILPGSTRYVSGGELFGDNSDVRPPTAAELWKGGIAGGGPAYRDPKPWHQMKQVTLVLDGIFFSDGEFAGPNEGQLWEHIVSVSEAYQEVTQVTREQFERGLDAERVVANILQMTSTDDPLPPFPMGPGADSEHFRRHAQGAINRQIYAMRRMSSDEKTVSMIVNWADSVLPQYRRP